MPLSSAPADGQAVHPCRLDEITRLRLQGSLVDRVVGRKRRGHGRNDAKDELTHVDSSRLKQYPTGRAAVNPLRPPPHPLTTPALHDDRSYAHPRARHPP